MINEIPRSPVKPLRLAQLLALSELVSALLLPGAYTFPFRYGLRADNWYEPALLLGNALGLLFVVVPAVTLVGLLRGRLLALWGLYLSPLLSFFLGVSAFPLIAHAVPAGNERTALLVVTNATAIVIAVALRARMGSSSPASTLAHVRNDT